MFLANIGGKDEAENRNAEQTKHDEELTKKLLEKAGIKSDLSDKEKIIA
jgi:hypothetical protein